MKNHFGKYASSTAPLAAVFFIIALFGFAPHAAHATNPAAFITTWKTNNPGVSASNQITIPTIGGPTYNYNVDWGDSSTSTGQTGNVTHTYASPGTYTVTITGAFPSIFFANGVGTDSQKILSIEQWGTQHWAGMYIAFGACSNLIDNATDVPDLSGVTNTAYMFLNDPLFNTNINNWDMSHVDTMYGMFQSALSFNQPLNSWNLSSAVDMRYMFANATSFNQPLSAWNVSNVTTMDDMFAAASSFNQDISAWNVSHVTSMVDMFTNTTISPANYGALLATWSTQFLRSGVTFNVGSNKYCDSVAVPRANIISHFGWTITDGGTTTVGCSLPASASTSSSHHAPTITAIYPSALGAANLDFTINGGGASTDSPTLALGFNADPGTVTGYAVSLDPAFTNGGIMPYTGALTKGTFELPHTLGTYTLYAEYFSSTGNRSLPISKTITYKSSGAAVPATAAASGSTFTRTLRAGSQGADVIALQQLLMKDGELVMPSDNGYGYFGKLTKTALEAFQIKYAIVASGDAGYGIFGPKSRAKAEMLLAGQ